EESQAFTKETRVADLIRWWPAKEGRYLYVSATRWHHRIEVHTAVGDVFPVVKDHLEGFWSPTMGQADFTSYWYFVATSWFRPNLDWWLYDADTGEVLEVGQADSSQIAAADAAQASVRYGLQAWHEKIVCTMTHEGCYCVSSH